jgi:hypothetical protein
MKCTRVGAAIAEDHAARAVGVAHVEVFMGHELAHRGQHVAVAIASAGLQGKPFVQHQSFVLEQGVKAGNSGDSQRVATIDQGAQGVEAVGHVACILEALQGFAGPDRVTRLPCGDAELAQGHAGQGAAA